MLQVRCHVAKLYGESLTTNIECEHNIESESRILTGDITANKPSVELTSVKVSVWNYPSKLRTILFSTFGDPY